MKEVKKSPLKAARERCGISQKCVAISVGVSAPTVSEWESGKKTPSTDNMVALSKLYHVSTDYLLGLVDESNSFSGTAFLRKLAICLGEIRDKAEKTQADVALHLGVPVELVNQWERGEEKIESSYLLKLLQYLKADFYEFIKMCDYEIMRPVDGSDIWMTPAEQNIVVVYQKADKKDRQIIDNIVSRYSNATSSAPLAPVEDKIIPLFGTAAAAGPGEMDTGLPWEDYAVPADSPADFAIRISGDSMEPVLQDGQIALCAEKTPQIGDVAVMQVNGCMLVKQFIRDSYGNLYLRSVNRDRSDNDVDVKASGNDTVLCFGTVLLPQRPALPLG